MRDRRGVIIYVGKAKNLRKRVLSYFRPGAKHPPKVLSMVNTVADGEWMAVKNEAEALLTESNLIKKYKPHFNILMRDDKRYLALRADPLNDFPYFTACRIVRDDGAYYFGPFPSAPIVRTAKDFVEKHWGLRECNAVKPDEETHRHCLADMIRYCSSPCKGCISPEEYKKRFEEACAFLRGERPQVLQELKERMKAASLKGEYEKAAALRDTIAALSEMTKSHFVRKSPRMRRNEAKAGLEELSEVLGLKNIPRVIECVDISNLFGSHNVASLVVAVDGIPDKRLYRHFKIESFDGADDPRAMAEVVMRRYRKDSSLSLKSPKADLLICDGGITQLRSVRATLKEIGVTDIPTIGLAERMEEIVFDDAREPLMLPRDSQALMVITRLRDEAHRFAITYHRNLREKTIRESVLDEIPGIGPAKKTALLKRFKSIYGIARANVAEIAATAKTGEAIAQAVKNAATKVTGG
jgi:excinuclease ABC subunit C